MTAPASPKATQGQGELKRALVEQPLTDAEVDAVLARPPDYVCTKCGYCGPLFDHMRSDGEPCRYMPGDVRALEHRLAAELSKARRLLARLAAGSPEVIEAMAREVFPDGWTYEWIQANSASYVGYRQGIARHKARAALAAGMKVIANG